MIPVDAQIYAPPGYLLVERAELPTRRGKIHFAPGIISSTRSYQGAVVSVGAGLEEIFTEGEGVLLSTSVGRVINMGLREEKKLYRVEPSLILARLDLDMLGEGAVENKGETPQQGAPDWEVEMRSEIGEGTPEALR